MKNMSQKTQQASMPNEAGFIGTLNRLRWSLKPTSFF